MAFSVGVVVAVVARACDRGASCDIYKALDCFYLHPRKRRNPERGPEAGVRGSSPGVWVRRTGGGLYAYTEGGSISIAILSVCVFVCSVTF